MEQARGDVLTDGKFTLAGEGGLTMEADYGVPASHLVAPGILWSSTGTATIIANISAWVDIYVATNGFPPGGMALSRRILNYMLQNAELRTLLAELVGTPGPDHPARAGQRHCPRTACRRSRWCTTRSWTSTAQHPGDPGRPGHLPPAERGRPRLHRVGRDRHLSGVGERVRADLSFSQAPGIVGVVEKSGPPYREWTFVDAVGMPVLANPKLLMVADVA
jgi:hypothetical protein